jgi:CDP-glucose 4,6-dehydratase
VGQREGALENMVSAWQGKRVFLTGHTGFKGSWLALWLREMGAEVCGYALDPCTEPNMFTLTGVARYVEDIRGDIRDFPGLQAAMTRFAPDVIFHLAAQPIVRRGYADPLGTYSTNVMGTVNVLEAVRKAPSVRAVVCVTTDKCYQNHDWFWPYRETDALGGYDPYASSKACAELVSAAYRTSFFFRTGENQHGVALATARAGNVIGGGDWAEDRLIPDLVRGFCSGRPVLIRRPTAIRPWQHVLEPLHGYLSLARKLLDGKDQFRSSYNFGPGEDEIWPVERIATKLVEIWGDAASWIRDAAPNAHEDHMLRLDTSKARAELEWRPRLGIEAALEWTVAWYRAWRAGDKMIDVTRKQIGKYEQLWNNGFR